MPRSRASPCGSRLPRSVVVSSVSLSLRTGVRKNTLVKLGPHDRPAAGGMGARQAICVAALMCQFGAECCSWCDNVADPDVLRWIKKRRGGLLFRHEGFEGVCVARVAAHQLVRPKLPGIALRSLIGGVSLT